MTAEIAIMNKTAVAMAADSAVTIGKDKVYNSANKLFALSSHEPVGIMFYGNSELNGVPWETVVQRYRITLGANKFDTLDQYADNFVRFIERDRVLFPRESQKEFYLQAIVPGYCYYLVTQIDKEVKQQLSQKSELTRRDVGRIATAVIEKEFDEYRGEKYHPKFSAKYASSFLSRNRSDLKRVIKYVFQEVPLTKAAIAKLERLAVYLICKDKFSGNTSGIVIAGFGEKDRFPSLVELLVETVIGNRLKDRRERCPYITFEHRAWIIAFAQSEMVSTFMEGIDPTCMVTLDVYVKKLFQEYPDLILDLIKQMPDQEKPKMAESIKKAGEQMVTSFLEEFKKYRRDNFVVPVTNAVAVLPKDELASMAESLVNLTSFKRRISMDKETVGGPIDVAVISKGDGFIWIKRKQYFDSELNPRHLSRYTMDTRGKVK